MIKTIVLASLLIAATTVNASVLPVAQGEASSFQASGNSGTAAPLDLSPSAGAPGADRLSAPVIFFQGEEDRVVPPNQAEMMVEALRKKGTPVGYLLFAGEQHGFRKAENIKRSLDAELYFYAVNVFRTGLSF